MGSKAVSISEDQIQKLIIEGLEWHGYLVMETSRRRKRSVCPTCGTTFWQAGGDGATKGVPDLLVIHKSWPKFVWVGLEVKGPNTRVSPEQAELAAEGFIFIVRSLADALLALKHVASKIAGDERGGDGQR